MARAIDGGASFFGRLVQVVAWLVIAVMAAALSVSVLIPRIAGAEPYSILTGSMRPMMPPGTLAVVKPTSADKIGIGTVVTYQLTSGKPTVVTHRVVAISFSADGEKTFTTQGDANNVADARLVRPAQIKGALWYEVPYLGRVNSYLNGPVRNLALTAVIIGLTMYAALMFAGSARERLHDRRDRRAAAAS